MRAILLLLLCGCAPAPVSLLDADPSRGGEAGTLGPHGALLHTIRAPARVVESVRVDLVLPVDGGGAPAVVDAPAVVLIHGGFVAPERYRWLAVHLASRGVPVAMPRADLLLAITEPGNGEIALATPRGPAATRRASSPTTGRSRSAGTRSAACSPRCSGPTTRRSPG